MSFARNFALGQQIGKGLVDTYQTAKQQQEFEDIQNARPEYSQGYTAQDGEQLAAIANAKDAQGNPYYSLDAKPDGTYGIRSNFQVQGANGQMVTPESVGIQQRNVATFLGQRYDADQLTPERLEGLRARALAGAVSRTDPIRGLGLMQSIKAGERDDLRFDWEKQSQPLKQRAAELQVAGAERTERQGVRDDDWRTALGEQYSAWDKMTPEEQRSYVSQNLNYSLEGQGRGFLTLHAGAPTKDGKPGPSAWQYTPEDGKGAPLSPTPEDVKHIFAVRNIQHIDPIRAQQEIRQLSKEGREAAMKIFGLNLEVGKFQETVRHNQAVEGNDAARTKAQGLYYGALRDRANRPQTGDLREFVNDKGEVTLVDITGLPRGQDGTIPLPAGLKPRTAKPQVTPEAYFSALEKATNAIGDPTKARMAVDQMFGLTAPTNDIAAQLKALNDKKAAPGGSRSSAPAAAPAPALGLSQRLGNAVSADNSAGNRNQFTTLANEAQQAVPAITQQINVLRNALGSTRSASERANLENKIGELESDLLLYSSILQQQTAQRGY